MNSGLQNFKERLCQSQLHVSRCGRCPVMYNNVLLYSQSLEIGNSRGAIQNCRVVSSWAWHLNSNSKQGRIQDRNGGLGGAITDLRQPPIFLWEAEDWAKQVGKQKKRKPDRGVKGLGEPESRRRWRGWSDSRSEARYFSCQACELGI